MLLLLRNQRANRHTVNIPTDPILKLFRKRTKYVGMVVWRTCEIERMGYANTKDENKSNKGNEIIQI